MDKLRRPRNEWTLFQIDDYVTFCAYNLLYNMVFDLLFGEPCNLIRPIYWLKLEGCLIYGRSGG